MQFHTGRRIDPVHLRVADLADSKPFHCRALAASRHHHGAPGERPYHPGYYGAFVLDPDGNNIEAVDHGPAQHSADSVVITAHTSHA